MPVVTAEDEVRLMCVEDGEGGGPALLLIPDWLQSAKFYNDLVPCLKGPYHIIRYDPRGSGRSDRPEFSYGLSREAADAAVVIESLGIGSAWVAGHGYGALVAVALALQAPELVKGLLLLAPVPVTGIGHKAQMLGLWRESLEDWRRLTDTVASVSVRRLDPTRLTEVGKDMAHTTRPAGLSQIQVMGQPGLETLVARLACPVHMMVAQYDEWAGPAQLRTGLLSYMKEARLKTLEEVGHYLALETPGPLAEAMLESLESAAQEKQSAETHAIVPPIREGLPSIAVPDAKEALAGDAPTSDDPSASPHPPPWPGPLAR